MSSIFDAVTQQLGGANLAQLSQHIGADEATTQQAVQAALPMLIGGLARNASNPNGAAALSSALGDHADGSALQGLGGLLGGGAGASILGHIFGNKQSTVEQGVGQATGLNQPQIGKLLMVLAPIVMAVLARKQQSAAATPAQAPSSGGLGDVLQREAQDAQKKAPGGLGGLIGMLDRDGDGNPLNDLARMAGGKGLGGLI